MRRLLVAWFILALVDEAAGPQVALVVAAGLVAVWLAAYSVARLPRLFWRRSLPWRVCDPPLELAGHHGAAIGATGSGKSTALARLIDGTRPTLVIALDRSDPLVTAVLVTAVLVNTLIWVMVPLLVAAILLVASLSVARARSNLMVELLTC